MTDTRTLYKGSRANAVDHMTVAYEHGFSFATVNCPIHIADGLSGRRGSNVVIDKKHFKAVNIAAGIVDADAMIVLSHFNGHDVAGFGGAIKNIAMGCATQAGKQQQRGERPGEPQGPGKGQQGPGKSRRRHKGRRAGQGQLQGGQRSAQSRGQNAPQSNGHTGPASCPGGNAQSKGIRQRIAQNALQRHASHSQSTAAQGRKAHAGKAYLPHNEHQGGVLRFVRQAQLCRQSMKNLLGRKGRRAGQTGQRQRNKPQSGQNGKSGPQPGGSSAKM